MGIYYAINALAGVVGTILGGWVAGIWGYTAVVLLAVIGVALGFFLSLSIAIIKSEMKRQSR